VPINLVAMASTMKLIGYPKEGHDEPQSIELSDVTVAAKSEELRKIAKFFEQAAKY